MFAMPLISPALERSETCGSFTGVLGCFSFGRRLGKSVVVSSGEAFWGGVCIYSITHFSATKSI